MTFSCQEPGCTREYQRREHLLRHQKDHANLRPYKCLICSASFNRKDLLSRHNTSCYPGFYAPLSLQPTDAFRLAPYSVFTKITNSKDLPTSLEATICSAQRYRSLTPQCHPLDAARQKQLEDLYFAEFHPHWPILHRHTYQHTSQPSFLVRVVQTVGLWMVKSAEAKTQAELLHEKLFILAQHKLLAIERGGQPEAPRSDLLATLQALMLVAILSLYRGLDAFPSLVVITRNVMALSANAGAFDQQRIDAENTDAIAQEQYQRLALVQFKLLVHINSLLVSHFPQFRLFEFNPQILNIRIPSPFKAWDESDHNLSVEKDQSILVRSLFLEKATPLTYQRLTRVTAWDFTTGMILWSFLKRCPGETLTSTTCRAAPFLFSHC